MKEEGEETDEALAEEEEEAEAEGAAEEHPEPMMRTKVMYIKSQQQI